MFLLRLASPRRICLFFTVLGLLLGAGIVLQMEDEEERIRSFIENDPGPVTTPVLTTEAATEAYTPKKVVVLMSLSKCGGSAIGELFNQNPDVFYFFEPLWGLEYAIKKSNQENGTTDRLDDYQRLSFRLVNSGSHCNVSDDSRIFLTVYMKNTIFSGAYRSESMRVLCGMAKKKLPQSESRCPINDNKVPDVIEQLCKEKSHYVVKVIRIKDIMMLRQFAFEEEVDYKILQVIRDPRSVVTSRLQAKYSSNSTVKKYTESHVREAGYQYLCRWMSDNARTQDSITPWLENRFATVRFEDFVTNRVTTAERMYGFVGLPQHKQVLSWLNAQTPSSVKRAEPWKTLLEWDAIRLIQNDPACQKVMRLFGYVPAADKSDLTSDGWTSVVAVPANVVAIS
ncbi:PREDICTED: carbohydrate sulfotransferase 3-like [Branchiostoma belcheri]|uniref:Carbohydrate sulfotransferase 3-like n=1 Tax=Branchiostoma belcheri TaxID=7741 RepID=A0A6P4XYG2_BRABE|nr:PREDICTED: carbohydrate sulfotransferase 3-like [Branchiostoma belcheri]